MTTKEFKMDDKTPFPLAYLDWCKFKGFKTIEETENKEHCKELRENRKLKSKLKEKIEELYKEMKQKGKK